MRKETDKLFRLCCLRIADRSDTGEVRIVKDSAKFRSIPKQIA
jgi:hypothetical protein